MRPVAPLLLGSLLGSLLACGSRAPSNSPVEGDNSVSVAGALPTGRTLDPEGTSRIINPITLTMLRAPQHRFVLVAEQCGRGRRRFAKRPLSLCRREPWRLARGHRPGLQARSSTTGNRRVSLFDVANGALVAELRDPPPSGREEGSTPSNVALSADGARLFVTEADANAVAIFDLSAKTAGVEGARGTDELIGRVPTDWYPSAVAVHGDRLLVANSKGHGTRPT